MKSASILSLPSEGAEMLHRRQVHVQEPVDAAGQALLLALLQAVALDRSHALFPANFGEVVCFFFA